MPEESDYSALQIILDYISFFLILVTGAVAWYGIKHDYKDPNGNVTLHGRRALRTVVLTSILTFLIAIGNSILQSNSDNIKAKKQRDLLAKVEATLSKQDSTLSNQTSTLSKQDTALTRLDNSIQLQMEGAKLQGLAIDKTKSLSFFIPDSVGIRYCVIVDIKKNPKFLDALTSIKDTINLLNHSQMGLKTSIAEEDNMARQLIYHLIHLRMHFYDNKKEILRVRPGSPEMARNPPLDKIIFLYDKLNDLIKIAFEDDYYIMTATEKGESVYGLNDLNKTKLFVNLTTHETLSDPSLKSVEFLTITIKMKEALNLRLLNFHQIPKSETPKNIRMYPRDQYFVSEKLDVFRSQHKASTISMETMNGFNFLEKGKFR